MPQTDWRLKGDWIKNCNCAFGCPCDFNARPTHGNCQRLVGMRVESGHFGSTKLIPPVLAMLALAISALWCSNPSGMTT